LTRVNFICVNERIVELLRLKKHQVVPAFLPPIPSKDRLPDNLVRVIESNSDKAILAANAFHLVLRDGPGLYRLDLCIDLAGKFKHLQLNFFIVFILANDNEIYHISLK